MPERERREAIGKTSEAIRDPRGAGLERLPQVAAAAGCETGRAAAAHRWLGLTGEVGDG